MEMDRKKFLDLWSPTDLPLCDDGMELAAIMIERSFQAVDSMNASSIEEIHEKVIGQRNGMIRAHKELVEHRANCPKCNESTADEK